MEPLSTPAGRASGASRGSRRRHAERRAAARLAVAAAALLAPVAGGAHDFWAERSGDALVLRHGHRGGEVLAIGAGSVKAIRCADGVSPPRDVVATARASREEVRVAAPCAVVSAFRDGGHWSLTPDGEVNLPRAQVPNAVRSWASRQYAKWVDARSGGAGAVVGDELELVPGSDLARARRGDKIAVRVLSAGRPVPDAVVSVGHRALGRSDSRGVVRLRLRAAGAESVSTSIRRPAATPDGDVEVIEASLTFEVRG